MVPPPVVIANIALGSIANAIGLCNSLVDRYDVKKDIKDSCHLLNQLLSSCREKAHDLNNDISQYRIKEKWEARVSEINNALKSIESRLRILSSEKEVKGNVITVPRRKFKQPFEMDKKLSAMIKDVKDIDMKIYMFMIMNDVCAEASATNICCNCTSQLQESSVKDEYQDEPASEPDAIPAPVETSTLDASNQHTAPIESTTAHSSISDLARLCKDLTVYYSRALIAVGESALLRVQEASVARAVAECSECLRLLSNKAWYFCGSNTVPVFVLKMALKGQPDAARHKIVDMIISSSHFCRLRLNTEVLQFRQKNVWNSTTLIDVSFLNALIFMDHFRNKDGPNAEEIEGFAKDINSELNISASDMLLVLQTMRQKSFEGQGLVIVLNHEQGLGWYRVVFVDADSPEQSSGVPAAPGFRLEHICSLELPGGGTNSATDREDIMILNFLHMAEIPPEGKKLAQFPGKNNLLMGSVRIPRGEVEEL